MLRKILFVFVMLAVFGMAAVSAEEFMVSKWKDTAFEDSLYEKIEERNCKEVFEMLWPLAKQGDYEAITEIASLTYRMGLNLPGRGVDYISRLRDYQILSVYAFEPKDSDLNKYFSSYIRALDSSDEFFQCHRDENLKNCAQIFVEEQVIPSFDSFSKEIDVFLKAGYEATCIGEAFPEDKPVISNHQNKE